MLVRDEKKLAYERDCRSYVWAETCATNEDKNITPDSFVLLFLSLFCFGFFRLPLDNKFPYFALKFYLFLILIPEG